VTGLRELAFRHWQESRMLLAIQTLLVLVSLAVGAALAFVLLSGWRSAARHNALERGAALSQAVAEAALPKIQQGDTEGLCRLLTSVKRQYSLLSATILDTGGNFVSRCSGGSLKDDLAASDVARKLSSVEGGQFFARDPVAGGEVIVFVRPVDSASRTVGQLRMIAAAPGWLPFNLSDLRSASLGIGVIGMLLLVGAYAATCTLRPLLALCGQIGSTGQLGNQRPLPVDGPTEVRRIAAGWNDMLSSFEQKHDTLHAANRELQLQSSISLYEKKKTDYVLDSLADGLIVLDKEQQVLRCNPAAELLLEVKESELVGCRAADVLPELGSVANAAGAPRALGQVTREVTVSRGDTEMTLQVTASPVSGADGHNIGSVLVVRDASQQRAERQARNEFVATVTHELRAPLTNIRSYVELLTDPDQDSPELRKEFFNVVSSESERLSNLISNLLNISKIEEGGYVLQRSPTKTRKLLQESIESVSSQAQSKNTHLQADLPDKLPELEVDKDMIRVVLMNLLSNGLKYTEAGGSVIVSAEETGDELRVHVTDTGCGIAQEDLPKVFDKFFRGRSAARHATGSGLGLAVSRQIARLHGGDLYVQSQIGEGTRVTLALPTKPNEVFADAQLQAAGVDH